MERLDLIVLGATGFTGTSAIENLLMLTKQSEYSNIKWGIAGRSMEKLNGMLSSHFNATVYDIPKMECNITDETSLKKLTGNAKIIVNCTGPNTVLSEPIVKACLASGTHYVDISAELFHVLSIYKKYHHAAEQAKLLVVLACGFATVPVSLGLAHLEKKFTGNLETVECYTELQFPRRAYFPGCGNCLVNYGTWLSLVYELKNFKEYAALKKEVFPQNLHTEEPSQEFKKSFFHRKNGYTWFPYPGPEREIVDITQRYMLEKRDKKPYHFQIFTTTPLFIHLLVVPIFFMYYYLSNFKCFRGLLKRYPRVFTGGYMSHKGPSKRMRDETKFSFLLTGKGPEPNAMVKENIESYTVKVSGSDPGYRSTSLMSVLSALVILKESDDMPPGGVLSAGSAFYNTSLVDRLNNNNIMFEIV